jgi:bifunctional DNA-binding transcriptional regulator/antitoxin component of YhaV-PrlF toxin-antitoxin module
MIAITKLKIDDRGRVLLPDHFLKANKIKKGTYVAIYPVYNREDSVRLQFEWEDKDDNR